MKKIAALVYCIAIGQLIIDQAQCDDICSAAACKNGGTLVVTDDDVICVCPVLFSGNRCEKEFVDYSISCQPDCSCISPGCQTKCTFSLQSWGWVDEPLSGDHAADGTGFIIINGKKVVDTTAVWATAATRGIHIVAVDPKTCAVLVTPQHFDPYHDADNTNGFIDFVNGQANGTILAAVTADEPSSNFAPAYPLIQSVAGLDLNDEDRFDFRGKFAFVSLKGFNRGWWNMAKSGGSHLTLNVATTGVTPKNIQFVFWK